MHRPSPGIPDYELLRPIGRGSYGEVWLVRSVTGVYRAAKVIYRSQFDDDRPFEREFAGIQRFEPISRASDSQIDILHVGRNEAGGYFYYLMELADDASLEGAASGALDPQKYLPKTLKSVMAARQRLMVSDALPIALSLADAVAHLHAHGLVHRDIKPSNIIFANGRAKLADIGLIAASDANRSFVGTEGYVPREGPGTAQADIFALGRVLYELCTGRDRLEFPSLPEDFERLPDRSDLLEFNEVLLKACEPDAALRYRSVAELKDDLKLIQARRSVRRLRSLERAVRRGRKLAVVGTLATILIGLGWYQSHRFNRTAAAQLAHVYVRNGQERFEQNDWLGALPWFAKALELEAGVGERASVHRLRIANTLEWCPQLVTLCTHSPNARYAFFNSDGTRALLCDPGTTAQVWDPRTDRPVTPKLEHGGQPYFAVFNPDSSRVATLSQKDGAARLWNVETGALIGSAMLHGAQVHAIAFSPDGRWLATAGDDGFARLWAAGDGAERKLEFKYGAPVSFVAFNRDAHLLMTYGRSPDKTASVRIWDTATGREFCASLSCNGSLNACVFDPCADAVITGTSTGDVSLWKLGATPVKCWVQSLPNPVLHLAFSPQGDRVLAATERIACLLEATTGKLVGSPIHSPGSLRSAEFSRDGSIFMLAGESRTATFYSAGSGGVQAPFIKHSGEIYRSFFTAHEDGWVTASTDGTVRRWRPAPGRQETAVFRMGEPIHEVFLAPDSHWVIGIGEESIARWSLGQAANKLEYSAKLPFAVTAAALSADSREILLASGEGGLGVVSTADLAVKVVPGSKQPIEKIVTNPRAAQAVLKARDGTVCLWDWPSGRLEHLALPTMGTVVRLEFSPDGKAMVLSSDRTVIGVQLTGADHSVSAPIQVQDRIWHIGFGADSSKLLISTEDRVIRWWNPLTGAPASPPLHGDGGINFAQFSSDQSRIFTASANYDAMIWDGLMGQPLTPPFKVTGRLAAVAFSPDHRWLAVTTKAGTLQVWDTASGEAMTPPIPTMGVAESCRFSADGRWLVTLEDNGVVCRPFLKHAKSYEQSASEARLLAGYQVDDRGILRPLTTSQTRQLMKEGSTSR